jgi:arabinose-5-phosphate isomerase
MGKSGIVGRKLVATFNSTGTPSMFMHPAEGLHGDVGILQPQDLIIAVSKSGNSDELEGLYPIIDRLGVLMIAITGNTSSSLARRSQVALDASVESEAGVDNLAPTSSTTATMALGDALALVVQEQRGFSPEDFSLLHPAGTLGRRLNTRIKDLMHGFSELPLVSTRAAVREMIVAMTSKRLGLALITSEAGRLVGIFTDGDLRRLVESKDDFLDLTCETVMTRGPKRIEPEALAEKALRIMEENKITALAITDSDDRPVGLVHIHDLLESKIV